MITVDDIVDFNFTDYGSVLECVALLQSIVDNNALISAETLYILDVPTRDSVFDEIDRDFWINCLLREFNSAVGARLVWGTGPHNLPAFYDPLGLELLNPGQTIFIDGDNNNAVYVGSHIAGLAYPNPQPRTDDKVYSDAARTTQIGDLWDSISDRLYNFKLWKDFSINERSSVGARRFPGDATEVTVYVRGGNYLLDREVRLVRQASGTTEQTRIRITKYPGEVATVRCANSQSPNDARYLYVPMFLVQRPLIYWGVDVIGVRDFGGGLFRFAPFLFQVTGNADRPFHLLGARLTQYRSIPPTHPQAATFPQYVCNEWNNRVTSGGVSTDNSGTWAIQYISSVGNAGSIRWCYIKGADINFPTRYGGEDVDCGSNVHNLTVSYSDFDGHAPHTRVRGEDFTTNNIVVEFCSFLHSDIAILLNGHNNIARYNRIHLLTLFAGDQIFGIQAHTDDEIHGNIVWSAAGENDLATTYAYVIGADKDFPNFIANSSRLHHNISYRNQFGMFYAGGFNPPASPLINDNTVDFNVFVDLAPLNKLEPITNAPIYINTVADINDWDGNTFPNNLIYRLDADDTVAIRRTSSSAHTDYTINTLPVAQFAGCYSADPKFVDPENGNFTLQPASPLIGLFDENVPLKELKLNCYDYLSQFITPEPIPSPELPKTVYHAIITVWEERNAS